MEKTGENADGNFYEGNGFMVFEDVQNGEENPEYYGWLGDCLDHDSAEKIDFESLQDAEEYFSK